MNRNKESIQLQLTLEEVNEILSALAIGQYNVVAPIINKISLQTGMQLSANTPEKIAA